MDKIIKEFNKAKVLVIGDCMLDTYYKGDANRISPEAPVPVVKIEKTDNFLGGAGNVARNITALGGSSELISFIGNDRSGEEIIKQLNDSNIKNSLINFQIRPTTVKSRILARNQQVIRFDQEDDSPISKQEKKKLLSVLEEKLPEYNVIVISDYGKGLIYKDLIKNIYGFYQKNKLEQPRILIDPKPKNYGFYQNAHLLTPNKKEAEELSGIKIKTQKDIILAGKTLIKKLNAENMLITLGEEGMALFSPDGIINIKSTAKQVFDVTGAGDTVIAVLATCLNLGTDFKKACKLSTLAAGIVVEKVGSATVDVHELDHAIGNTKILIEEWE